MIPERYAPAVYRSFRVVFGFLFLFHGLQKFGLLGGLDGKGAAAPLASHDGRGRDYRNRRAARSMHARALHASGGVHRQRQMAVAYFHGAPAAGGAAAS